MKTPKLEKTIYEQFKCTKKAISAFWEDAPFRYWLKYKFSKAKIFKVLKECAYSIDYSDEEDVQGFFFMVGVAYSYYVACGIKKLLPKNFTKEKVLTFLPLAIASITEKYGSKHGISLIFYKKSEVASIAIQLYNDTIQNFLKEYTTKEKEIETPINPPKNDTISLWVDRLIRVCWDLLKENKCKNPKYDFANNRYVYFDFCLFAYFNLRAILCSTLRIDAVRKSEEIFDNFIEKRFAGEINENEMNSIIDSRLIAYDKIMQSKDENSDKDDSLQYAFIQFLLKDFNNRPLDTALSIIAADEHFCITNYVLNLIFQLYSRMDSFTKDLQKEYGIN